MTYQWWSPKNPVFFPDDQMSAHHDWEHFRRNMLRYRIWAERRATLRKFWPLPWLLVLLICAPAWSADLCVGWLPSYPGILKAIQVQQDRPLGFVHKVNICAYCDKGDEADRDYALDVEVNGVRWVIHQRCVITTIGEVRSLRRRVDAIEGPSFSGGGCK